MPPSDQEPRYRLVDSNDNVVGALWGDGNGNVKIADETDTQTTFGPDGISTPALEATSANIGNLTSDTEQYNYKTVSVDGSNAIDAADKSALEVDIGSTDSNLDTITGGENGQTVIIRKEGPATLTLRDRDDNLRLNSATDKTLDGAIDRIVLEYDKRFNVWVQRAYSNQ